MSLGLDAGEIARKWAALGVTKADTLRTPDSGADSPEVNAASAFVMSLTEDGTGMTDVFSQLYPDAYAAGAKAGMDKLSAVEAPAPSTELASAVHAIDWDGWMPGDPKVAAEIAGDGLKTMLDRAKVEIKRITGSTLGDLTEALATGVREGQSIDQMTDAITAVLHDPKRAETIARTEVNRAMSLGDLDSYRSAGISRWEWLDSEGAPVRCARPKSKRTRTRWATPCLPNTRTAAAPRCPW